MARSKTKKALINELTSKIDLLTIDCKNLQSKIELKDKSIKHAIDQIRVSINYHNLIINELRGSLEVDC